MELDQQVCSRAAKGREREPSLLGVCDRTSGGAPEGTTGTYNRRADVGTRKARPSPGHWLGDCAVKGRVANTTIGFNSRLS